MKESYNPENILYAWMYVHAHMYVCIYICSYVSMHAQFCYSYIIIIVQNAYTMLTDVTPVALAHAYLQLLAICLVLSLCGVPIWAWLATHVASNYKHDYI